MELFINANFVDFGIYSRKSDGFYIEANCKLDDFSFNECDYSVRINHDFWHIFANLAMLID